MKLLERSSFFIVMGLVIITLLIILFDFQKDRSKQLAVQHGLKLANISNAVQLKMSVDEVKAVFKNHDWPDTMIRIHPRMITIYTPTETFSMDWVLFIGLEDSHVIGLRFGISDDARIRPDGAPADRGGTDFW